MKQLSKTAYLPWLTLFAGGVGIFLRFWLFSTGVDDRGLLVEGHPADLMIWLLTAIVLVGLWFATKPLVAAPKYDFNYPPSLAAAIGCGFAALGIGIAAIQALIAQEDTLSLIAAIVGITTALAFVLLALLRYRGLQPNILLHVIPCVFFMLRLISLYRHWSTNPQLQNYGFQLLGTVFLMLSAYYRAAFDVDMGRRRPLVLCHLITVFFCCLSITDLDAAVFYLTTGIWLFTDLCSLAPLQHQVQEDDHDPS